MENIIQFILTYNNSNVVEYFIELRTKINSVPNCDTNDVLFTIIDILIKKHDVVDILTYDHIIPLLEYIIKQARLNGPIMTRDGKKLIDLYMEIKPTLYQNSEFTKHVNRYIESVSITNNMMSLFNNTLPSSPHKQSVPITMEELLQRVERLENEVRELKSKL
jgi:hypothetical protein